LAYKFAQKNKLSEDNFLKAHKYLSKSLVSINRQGKYREESVGVFSSIGLEYMAIESKLVKKEMDIFFNEIDNLLKQKMTKKEVYFWSFI